MKYLIIIIFSTLLLPAIAFSALLVPEVYVGGAYIYGKSTTKYQINNDTIKYSLDYPKSGELVLGIRPIPKIIPIISDLRFDLQVGTLSSRATNNINALGYKIKASDTASYYGATLYLDVLTFIPIVNPYIGYGYRVVNHNARLSTDSAGDFNSKFKSTMNYVLVGLNFAIPLLPLNVYLETQYANSRSTEKPALSVKSTQSKIGVRYSFFGS